MERNRVELAGNLGNDPQITDFESGKAVVTFSIAESSHQKEGDDGKRPVIWHNIECWNKKIIDNIEKFLKKGDNVDIVGYLKYQKWEDKEGIRRNTTVIVANEIERLNKREK